MLQLETRPRFTELLDLACGRVAEGDEGPARKLQLALACTLGALLFSALWGFAAGSGNIHLAATNTVKVPLVILLSALCAVPPGLLALRLSGIRYRASDLLLSFASGVFAGSLVLAVLAPLVAVYYHTSALIGSKLAIASAFTAITVGIVIFARNAFARAEKRATSVAVTIAVAAFTAILLLAMVQFVAIASPMLPNPSAFDGGIDTLLGR
jgi:hypothetical protein